MGELTATQLQSLAAPGRFAASDGLMLVIDSAGRKYWRLRHTLAGKQRDHLSWPVRALSLLQAREAVFRERHACARDFTFSRGRKSR